MMTKGKEALLVDPAYLVEARRLGSQNNMIVVPKVYAIPAPTTFTAIGKHPIYDLPRIAGRG